MSMQIVYMSIKKRMGVSHPFFIGVLCRYSANANWRK